MWTSVLYGCGASVALDIAPSRLLARLGGLDARPLPDVAGAVRIALREPIGFPRLDQTVYPGDRVAVALDEGLLQSSRVVSGAVHALLDAGVDPSDISVLVTRPVRPGSTRDPLRRIPSTIRGHLELHAHRANDPAAHAYLATTRENQPLYLNRRLCDADLVITIGLVRPSSKPGYLGVAAALYPAFSDLVARRRFRTPMAIVPEEQRQMRRREIAEAAWLLGARMSVQVIPGPNGQVSQVLAGDIERIDGPAQTACDQLWHAAAPRCASLVLAAVSGGRGEQTWSNVGRAVHAALQLVEEEGAIAVCSELRQAPGPSLKRLRTSDSWEKVLRTVDGDTTRDAMTAAQLTRALQRARVYLLSHLAEDTVEELGLAYVDDERQLLNLARRHSTCIVLENAQHVAPVVSG